LRGLFYFLEATIYGTIVNINCMAEITPTVLPHEMRSISGTESLKLLYNF
jgi:hypothetical protein